MNKMKLPAASPAHLQVLLVTVISILAFVVLLVPKASARAESPLVVGITEAPPFVVKTSDGRWSGPVFELWEHVAEELEQSYTLREMDLVGKTCPKCCQRRRNELCRNHFTYS